jgi:glycosyltransferase involved in cell wall biosynthesis
MASFLEPLWKSVQDSGLSKTLESVLFVDDGSTDETPAVLARIQASGGADREKVKVLRLEQNQGRFQARLQGAQACPSERILFLDSRILLPAGFGNALERIAPLHRDIMGFVDIDPSRSVFSLYWDRSHRALFGRHYRDGKEPFLLTPQNFDEYLKGTGILLCSRAGFIRACSQFAEDALLSDDTYLMRRMVDEAPILAHPGLRITWVPRESWKPFLARLFERGPSFVEYHVFQRRSGPFFWVVLAGALGTLAWLAFLALAPVQALTLAAVASALAALSVVGFTRRPSEVIRMMPLHLGVLFSFGAGILYGLWVNSSAERKAKWLKRD